MSEPVQHPRASVRARQRLVLLAEDDMALRELLRSVLVRDGYRVLLADSGTRLIDHVRRVLYYGAEGGSIVLVLSDVRMPGFSGVTALQLLRDAEIGIPVILLTAYGDRRTRAQATEHGAVLLEKPIELGVLRAAVREALGVPALRGPAG